MITTFDKYDPEIQDLLIKCLKSTKVFAQTFFPDEVSSAFNELHDKIFQVIDDKTVAHRKKAIAAPRGLGKTTLAKLRVIKAIVFRETNFVVYLSNSATSAEEATEHIKRLLLENTYLQEIFGSVKFSTKGFKDGFSKQSWVAYGDVYVLPRGNGQQVRGKNWMGHRPGLFVIDDLESTELVRSDEQRLKLEDWFFSDLMKSESKYGKQAEFLYIDTIKHQDALLQKLINSSDWQTVNTLDKVLSICDANFNTYDKNYMTTEEIKQEYNEHVEKGKTDLFYMEYMNIPISLKDAIFKEEYFKYYEEAGKHLIIRERYVDSKLDYYIKQQNKKEGRKNHDEYVSVRDLITLVIVDPAKTVKLHSAESAVITISVSRDAHKIFIRDVFSQKVRPDELYEAIFHSVLLYQARYLAVEVTSLHEFISQPIRNQMKIRGLFPTFIELNAVGDKDMRIATLAPHYRQGYVYHNKSSCSVLENQLKWHPKSKLKDAADATSYITKLLDDEYLFFSPDGDDDGYDEVEEDEFFDLHDEELLTADWRIA